MSTYLPGGREVFILLTLVSYWLFLAMCYYDSLVTTLILTIPILLMFLFFTCLELLIDRSLRRFATKLLILTAVFSPQFIAIFGI